MSILFIIFPSTQLTNVHFSCIINIIICILKAFMGFLLQGFYEIGRNPSMIVMWIIGGLLIYLAIKKDIEPALLLPMGFGAILVNLPLLP